MHLTSLPTNSVRAIGHTLRILGGEDTISRPDSDVCELAEIISEIKRLVQATKDLQSDFLGVRRLGRGVATLGSSMAKQVSLQSLGYMVELATNLWGASRPRAPLVQINVASLGKEETKKTKEEEEKEKAEDEEKRKEAEVRTSRMTTALFAVGGTFLAGASLSAAEAGAELRDEVEERMTQLLNRMGDGVFYSGVTANAAFSRLAEMLQGHAATISLYCKETTEIGIATELKGDLQELGEKIDNTQTALISIAEKRRQAGLAGAAAGISLIAYALLPRRFKALAGFVALIAGSMTIWKAELIPFNKTRDQRILEAFERFSSSLETKYQNEAKKAEIRAIIAKLKERQVSMVDSSQGSFAGGQVSAMPEVPATHLAGSAPFPVTGTGGLAQQGSPQARKLTQEVPL